MTDFNSLDQIAHEALDNLETAKRALNHLETVLFIAEGMASKEPRLQSLLNLAWFYAVDAANLASCHAEDIGDALIAFAPQKATSANRGADQDGSISLADFAKGRQIAAAKQLGITQQALNTALKLNRQIQVKVFDGGRVTAVEVKAFPSPGRRACK